MQNTTAPVVTALFSEVEANSFILASSMFTVTDADDNATVTMYRFRDNSTEAGSFVVNGMVQPANQFFDVTPFDLLFSTVYRGDTEPDFESFDVQVFDGLFWSNVARQGVQTVVKNLNPPQVTALPSVVGISQQIDLSSMFQLNDADLNSEVQLYRFRDNGIGGGAFIFNGQGQNPNQFKEITAAQLGAVTYRGGPQSGSETFSVQAYDGVFWSNIALGRVTTGNSTPVFTGKDGRVAPFDYVPLQRQFQVTDADGDSIIRYEIIDRRANTDGGHLTLRRQRLPSGQILMVEAGDIGDVEYRGGTTAGQSEDVSIRGYDGFSWSEYTTFEMTTSSKPLLSAVPVTVLTGQKRLFTDLFSFSDAEGDPAFAYSMIDRRLNSNGGYFEFKGQRVQSAKWFPVLASEANQLFYVGGSFGTQSETVSVQAFDGFEFSDPLNFDITTAPRPSVIANNIGVKAGQFLNVSSGSTNNTSGIRGAYNPFFFYTPATERFQFLDQRVNGDGGHFILDGATVPSNKWFDVDVADIGKLEYRGGIVGPQSEKVFARSFAQGVWSAVTSFNVTTLENQFAPQLNLIPMSARLGTEFQVESLFTWSDGDGDSLKTFGVYDTGSDPTTGAFFLNGVKQPAQQWIFLDFDQITNMTYRMPTVGGSEKIRMIVSDGRKSSVAQTALMRGIPTPEIVVTVNDLSLDTLENVDAASLFFQADIGPAFTQYQVFDENFDANPLLPPDDRSGRLFLRQAGGGNLGEELLGGVVHTLSAEEFSRLELQAAEVDFGRQLDPFLVRASNGTTGWSEWRRVNVNTDPVGGDSLFSGTLHNAVVENGKTVVTYTFIDGGNQAGGTRSNPKYPPLPTYYPPGSLEALGTRALDQPMREVHREVLDYYERVANIDFVEVPFTLDGAEASIAFGAWGPFDGSLASAAAYAYFTDGDGRGNLTGDIWYDVADFPINGTEVGLGSFYRYTAFHEIGHAVGLKHPFEGDPSLSIFNNFDYNTVMAYNHDGPNNKFDPYADQGVSLMLYDMVELQRIYGANMGHRTGNDHYGNLFSGSYPHFVGNDEQHQSTIWDAGGDDTLNFVNHTANETIDLREGTWTTINGVPQSLRIQYGTIIENARGGSGDDMITGNETNNLLFGNAGNDTFRGGGGNDIYRGGTGDDIYQWSLGDNTDTIREEGSGGLDRVEFYDPSGAITSLSDDFTFRRFGNDLHIELTLNQGLEEGKVIISDFANNRSRVDTMRFHGVGGNQVQVDIDLGSIFATADATAKKYRPTSNETILQTQGANGTTIPRSIGFIAVPV